MNKHFAISLVIALSIVACKKENNGDPINTQPPPAPKVLLKEMVVESLPSPYYHFDYNSAGQIMLASFASGLDIYNVTYVNGRISEMKNSGPANFDTIQYTYDNSGRVILVNYVDFNGKTRIRVVFNYDGNKLIGLNRKLNINNNFVPDKSMTFTYYPDGNLSELTQHRFAVGGGQTNATYSDKFEQYDNKLNADGFSLIHDDFFDNLILLPDVQLQINNPGKVTQSGDGVNYTEVYTYEYNEKNLPITKNGQLTLLNGADAGHVISTRSTFTYY